jgi:hypothetical protein
VENNSELLYAYFCSTTERLREAEGAAAVTIVTKFDKIFWGYQTYHFVQNRTSDPDDGD